MIWDRSALAEPAHAQGRAGYRGDHFPKLVAAGAVLSWARLLRLLLLLYHFGVQVYEFVLRIPHASETDVILGLLSLIDVVFTGNLVLIVVLSGYENFVSRIESGDHDRPN
jgi:uncharacterized protein (TIGR00645 family)